MKRFDGKVEPDRESVEIGLPHGRDTACGGR
jgi:hypothetical protein